MTWLGVNRVSTTDRVSSCYMMETGTPKAIKDIEAGRGNVVNVFTKQHIGLVAQYAGVGLVFGVLPSTVYPFMQAYLNASGALVMTVVTLIVMPFSLKVFFGVLSDCVPIGGYRRRPYMVIGWTICFAMLLCMACMKVGEPYFLNPAD